MGPKFNDRFEMHANLVKDISITVDYENPIASYLGTPAELCFPSLRSLSMDVEDITPIRLETILLVLSHQDLRGLTITFDYGDAFAQSCLNASKWIQDRLRHLEVLVIETGLEMNREVRAAIGGNQIPPPAPPPSNS